MHFKSIFMLKTLLQLSQAPQKGELLLELGN